MLNMPKQDNGNCCSKKVVSNTVLASTFAGLTALSGLFTAGSIALYVLALEKDMPMPTKMAMLGLSLLTTATTAASGGFGAIVLREINRDKPAEQQKRALNLEAQSPQTGLAPFRTAFFAKEDQNPLLTAVGPAARFV